MNRTILSGRICSSVEVKYIQGKNGESVKIATYRLAVPRSCGSKALDSNNADYIQCVAYKGFADFAEKNLAKGMKLMIEGKIHTGSYDDKSGNIAYYAEVIVDKQELSESREVNDKYRKYADNNKDIDYDFDFSEIYA